MGTNTNESDEIEIDLLGLLEVCLHFWWIIAITTVVGLTAGLLISKFLITEQYESTTRVYILNKKDDSTLTTSDIQLGTQVTKDYAEIIKSRTTLEKVIADNGLEITYGEFSGRVTVSTQSDTRIVSISVRDRDPYLAKQLADDIREVSSERITDITAIEAVNLVDEGNIPQGPASPNVKMWALIGGAIGFLLSAAVITIRFLMDDTIKVSDDVERYLGLSTLGMIPVNVGQEENKHGKTKKKKSRGWSSGRTQSGSINSRHDHSIKATEESIRQEEIDVVTVGEILQEQETAEGENENAGN